MTTSHTPSELILTHDMLVAKIGKEVPEKEVQGILTRLGFEVASKN